VLSRLQGETLRARPQGGLVVLQGLDAAGKDGVVKHVMSGVNPQGCDVHAFKTPSNEELNHDYLWRSHKCIPERGKIGIFNRSYYEEVLIVRVHPTVLRAEKLPDEQITKHIWEQRHEDINAFEEYLTRNGVVIRKFFLHISKEEAEEAVPRAGWKIRRRTGSSPWPRQRTRLLEGLPGSLREMIQNTATKHAPVVRGSCGQQVVYAADRGFRDYPGARRTHLSFPEVDKTKKKELEAVRHSCSPRKD